MNRADCFLSFSSSFFLDHWRCIPFRWRDGSFYRLNASADPTEHNFCSVYIIIFFFDAVVVTEIKFSQIPMEMLFRAMLINAPHPALENREITFDGVSMDSGIFERNILARLWQTTP